jgi:hypothetical protein
MTEPREYTLALTESEFCALLSVWHQFPFASGIKGRVSRSEAKTRLSGDPNLITLREKVEVLKPLVGQPVARCLSRRGRVYR